MLAAMALLHHVHVEILLSRKMLRSSDVCYTELHFYRIEFLQIPPHRWDKGGV